MSSSGTGVTVPLVPNLSTWVIVHITDTEAYRSASTEKSRRNSYSEYFVAVHRPDGPVATIEGVPSEHDGGAFAFDVRFSEALGAAGQAPVAASFHANYGRVTGVERVEATLWRVRVEPKSWRDVTVTLVGNRSCGKAGAVCTGDGRVLSNTVSASVTGPPRIVLKRSWAREKAGAAVRFLVRLSRAVSHEVTVDYVTADATGVWRRIPPATAGLDYTATSGRLTFAPGERFGFVEVPVLDDAINEGTEHFLLRFSNPQGAYLRNMYHQTVGLIRNDDPLQAMWLSRFGRTVGSQVTDAVSERLAGGLAPGTHATLAGQSLDLSRADDGKALAEAMTGLARAFGASDAPAANDDPFARHGPSREWNESAATTAARSMTGRELLLGSSFHLATEGEASGAGLAAWGRVAHGSFDGEHADDSGSTRVDGEVVTGIFGADAEWERVLAGVAVSVSKGEGGFDSPGVDRGQFGTTESTMTAVSPYARLKLTERVSAWGLAGFGTGDMTIRFDDGVMDPIRTDIGMRMGAFGARGALLEQDASGGMDLALKADAFFVRMDSEKAANSVETEADASRVRLVLEGGRAYALSDTATLRPSLELGLRHDGRDAETGTGVELGGGVSYVDAATGLSIEARARMLVAHADLDYESGARAPRPGSTRASAGGGSRSRSRPPWARHQVPPSGCGARTMRAASRRTRSSRRRRACGPRRATVRRSSATASPARPTSASVSPTAARAIGASAGG